MLKSLLGTLEAEVTVLECSDGREAVERFAKFAPDWVLMDIEMPHLDGLSATRQITAQSPRTRVVMVSHHDDPDLLTESARAGAIGYVRKDNLQQLPGLLLQQQPLGQVPPRPHSDSHSHNDLSLGK